MGFARCGDLVQCAARQTAAERSVDCFDPEGQAAGHANESGGFLQGLQVLTQLIEHELSLWKRDGIHPSPGMEPSYMFPVCSSVPKGPGAVKSQGIGSVRR